MQHGLRILMMQPPKTDRNAMPGMTLPSAEALKYIHALENEDWQVRFSAAEALAKIGDPQAVEPLLTVLWDVKWRVRYVAAWALGEIGDLRAVEPLGAAYQEWGLRHRYSAALALWHLGNLDRSDKWIRQRENLGLPLQILSSMTLTPIQKLNSLQALIGVIVTIGGIDRKPVSISYDIEDVQSFCEKVCRKSDTKPIVKQGAGAVLAELQNRKYARTLLRSGERDDPREQQELLRTASSQSDTAPSDELLRSAEPSLEPADRARPGILSRIFKRK
ncbi:MAG: lyase [Chthonomonadaceae bacterium]|nr:lyase [Chthonomonadaceae bacterium]